MNPGLIRPLFFNLIGNALKYCKKDVLPVITIRNIRQMSEQVKPEYCRISIEDNGIGFDQVYAEQVFDMFRRLHVNKDYEGTGIGLALCKKIVEKHHGFISAESPAQCRLCVYGNITDRAKGDSILVHTLIRSGAVAAPPGE